MRCLDDEAILALVASDASEARAAAEPHLDECDMCRRLVAEAMRRSTATGGGNLGPAFTPEGVEPQDPAGSLVGCVLLNHRVVRKIGAGGFGEVYAAEHVDLGRGAAVKVLRPEFAAAPAVVERFFREARAACSIDHPAVVEIENFGRLETGEPFLLMELLDGRTLAEEIATRGALPADELAAVFAPIADALAAAHRRGIVHRDLKPENIMLVPRAAAGVKLLDFGIAKLLELPVSGSRTGHIVGTPLYMAPEQANDAKTVDARSDVYSFAATFYTAAAGRPPIVASGLMALLAALQSQTPPRLSQFAPWAGGGLDAAVARCLAKDPSARPETMEEAWRHLAAGLDPQERRPRRRHRWLAATGATAAATVAVGMAVWYAVNQSPSGRGPDHADTIIAAGQVAAVTPGPSVVDAAPLGPADAAAGPMTASPPIQPPALPAASARRRAPRHPATPAAGSPVDEHPPDPRCGRDRFARILDEDAPPMREVRDALKDLKDCHGRKLIGDDDYDRIQTGLISRL